MSGKFVFKVIFGSVWMSIKTAMQWLFAIRKDKLCSLYRFLVLMQMYTH